MRQLSENMRFYAKNDNNVGPTGIEPATLVTQVTAAPILTSSLNQKFSDLWSP